MNKKIRVRNLGHGYFIGLWQLGHNWYFLETFSKKKHYITEKHLRNTSKTDALNTMYKATELLKF